jgi:hypothetical protein
MGAAITREDFFFQKEVYGRLNKLIVNI